MKVKREWNDNEELAEAIHSALGEAYKHCDIDAHYMSGEQGPYGEDGVMMVTLHGRKFSLELHEVL